MNTSDVINIAKIGALAIGVYVVVKGVKSAYGSISDSVPTVIKEGFTAGGELIIYGGHLIADPLDAFGVRPAVGVDGKPLWEKTYPWGVGNTDPVSNNDSGINFNYF